MLPAFAYGFKWNFEDTLILFWEDFTMREEEKLLTGKLYCPRDPDLKAQKLRCHNLCRPCRLWSRHRRSGSDLSMLRQALPAL